MAMVPKGKMLINECFIRGCSGRTFSGIGSGRVVPEFFSRVSGKRPRVSGTDSGSVSKGILTFLNSVHNIF